MIRAPVHPLRLKIRDITDEGTPLDAAFDRAFLAEALDGMDADLDGTRAETHLVVTKFGENVFVRGRTTGELVIPCARCLTATKVALDLPVRVTYAPEDAETRGETLDDDEEFATHDRQYVDLAEVLREGIILAAPMTPLCKSDCAGLCPVCGVDKNATPCDCDPRPPDPRFAALGNLKLTQ